MSDLGSVTADLVFKMPCPASIWLLGSVTSCHKPLGHDGDHEVIITWRVS